MGTGGALVTKSPCKYSDAINFRLLLETNSCLQQVMLGTSLTVGIFWNYRKIHWSQSSYLKSWNCYHHWLLRYSLKCKKHGSTIIAHFSGNFSMLWSVALWRSCLNARSHQPMMIQQCFNFINILPGANGSLCTIRIYLHWKKLLYNSWRLKMQKAW